MKSPYNGLPPKSFWRSGVSETHPLTVENLYRKKFDINQTDKIATAGSCFAQHVASYLRKNGYLILDAEPPPAALSEEKAKEFGYKIYSARYGNIYTVRQLLQLARDAEEGHIDAAHVWTKGGRFYDALRPNIEPNGFESIEEALALRRDHLERVKQLFRTANVLIFTLGLTEAWIDKTNGRVFPTAPGTIAGSYDPEKYLFKNFDFTEIRDDFVEFYNLVRKNNPHLRILLTVSPVPLTATASDNHVLVATTYSKSVLRAVAGALAEAHSSIDYFPSYEIVASPWSKGFFYEANMREVNSGGVAAVMRVFFEQHNAKIEVEDAAAVARQDRREQRRTAKRRMRLANEKLVSQDDIVCEEILLEAFAP